MSFASDVKKELTMLEINNPDNAKAELSALLRMNGSLGLPTVLPVAFRNFGPTSDETEEE